MVSETVSEYLDGFSKGVARIMEDMTIAIIRCATPAGAQPDDYKFSFTHEELRNGIKIEIARDGKIVGSVMYNDGYVTAKSKMHPILGKRP